MKIGYIGLGSMGAALARRLVAAHDIIVWDINSAATAAFEKLGATVAPCAAELARQCDVVLLCLPRTSDVRELIFGAHGLAEGLASGKLVVDQTSGVPDQTREIAARLATQGVAMIDAPVSGGVMGAKAGTISIMFSGAAADCGRALPVLRDISPNVFHCGDRVGDGQAMKLCNNLLSAGCRVSTFEIVAMGRKMGLSLATISEMINKGSGRNRTTKVTLHELSEGRSVSSHFAMALMLKDMNQVIQLGMDCGAPTTLTNIVRGILQTGINLMGENAQLEKVIDLIENMAGTKIKDAPDTAPPEPVAPLGHAGKKELRVGYVGLGTMGGALVRRLMLSRTMHVFDANADTVRTFETEGATAARDLPSLARECDVIFICVPTSAIVREVIFGKDGLAAGLAPGKIVVDQTTGDPNVTIGIGADLQKLGVALVDAPVAGGARGAVAGTIAIMAGGVPDAIATVWPLFESISPNVVYCGTLGNGHIAKLVNNAIATCNCLLTYEAASLAVKYGLKLTDVSTVINKSTGWSAASERILPSLSEGTATAGFQLGLMVKDLKLAGAMAIHCGAPMLVARTVCNLYEAGANILGQSGNIDEMAPFYESMSNIRFVGA